MNSKLYQNSKSFASFDFVRILIILPTMFATGTQNFPVQLQFLGFQNAHYENLVIWPKCLGALLICIEWKPE